ncbi:MAG: ABC transporter permease [Planctomycetes bacterium]|nr:ABC transporter permease [Planctomycetota bacterium]
MPVVDAQRSDPASEAAPTATGRRVALAGRLDLSAAIALWNSAPPGSAPMEVDLAKVDSFTGGGAATLVALAGGRQARFVGASDDLRRYLAELPLADITRAGALEQDEEEEEELAVGEGGLVEFVAAARWFIALGFEFVYWVVVAPWRGTRLRLSKAITELNRIGVEAIPIVALIGALMGVILALNAAGQLRAYGAEKFTANLVGIALTRELAPVITAILVAGRSGSAIAAEIATMQVSDEIDALRVMGINPRAFLLVPKLLAMTIAMPVLVVLGSLVGIGGGFMVAVFGLGLPFELYWDQTIEALHVRDLVLGTLKALCFGALIGLTGCTLGMRVTGGATGVGRVTTTAVVVSYVLVIVANAFFTLLFFLAGF